MLKYLVSTADLKYRPPYGKAYSSHRRYASFIGTTNEPMPLVDPTGSRRFICVTVDGDIDFETPINYPQLYAQLKYEVDDMAKADYDAFLAIQPQHFEAHLGLAHVLQKMGRKADILDELNLIVQQFPDSADAYAARAAYETEQKLYDVALYDWDEALRRQPSNAEYAVSKADILIGLGRRKEARETLDALVAHGTSRGALKEWYDKCK